MNPQDSEPDPRQSKKWTAPEIALILAAAVLVVLSTRTENSSGDTANSRLATVVALVHHGTWNLDRPSDEGAMPFAGGTVDKVKIDDRLLSSKPPVLPLVMAGEYYLLNRLFGLSLLDAADLPRLLKVISLSFAGLPFLIALWAVRNTLAIIGVQTRPRFAALFALAFATQLWPYATLINNHVPAASLLALAVLALASWDVNPESRSKLAAFAFFGAFACTIDLPAAFFVAPLAAYAIFRSPQKNAVALAAGAAIPLALHLGLTLAITGSLLPIQLRPELYLYEASYWRNPRGVDALNESKSLYLFHMTVGRVGLFSLYPILLFAFLALPRSAKRRRFAWASPCIGVGFVLFTVFYMLISNNYGGEAYGFRWYIVALPALGLLLAQGFSRLDRPLHYVVAAVLIAVSAWSAWECSQTPWRADAEWTTRVFGPSL